MAQNVTNYQCPACMGPMQYSGTTGKLECEYCGSSYSVQEVEQMMGAAHAAAAAAENDEWEYAAEHWNGEGMHSYICPSCNAELVCDATTAATSCPYCGNPTIVPAQFTGMLKPEYVIPFKVDKKAAMEALKKHYQGKKLLPKSFTEGNHIEEVKGVYVPFWLYDGTASGTAFYTAEKDKVTETPTEKITTTEHYSVIRAGDFKFEKVPANATTKLDDNLMDSIEPFDYTGIKEFSQAYMAGYMADKYDVSAEDNTPRMEERVKASLQSMLRNTVNNYDRVETTKSIAHVRQGKVSYAMLPVWLLSTRWNGQNFMFAMNGQTGRMVGALPMGKQKYWRIFACIIAVIDAVLALMTILKGTDMTVMGSVMKFGLVPALVALIVCSILKSQLKSVYKASGVTEYIKEGGLKLRTKSDRFVRKTVKREKKQQK